jgi:hypothetical protein
MSQDFNPQNPSEGLGDTIAKITHAIGIDKVAEGVARAMGKEDCGCNKRRQVLNKVFPYAQTTPPTIPTPVLESQYVYEGTRQFRVLSPFLLKSGDFEKKFEVGDILESTTRDVYYIHLQNLLQSHSIEPI